MLGLEQAPGHGHAFGQSHRSELHAANHVANGQDRRRGGLVLLVNTNVTPCVQLDAGVFQAQVVQHRAPAGGIEHAIGDQLAPILEGGLEAAVLELVDALDVGVELQVEPALFQFFLQVRAYRTVEATQEQVATVQKRGSRPQALEDASELDRDIATAHHQHSAWQVLEVEGFVGGDGQFLARNVRHLWPATGGD